MLTRLIARPLLAAWFVTEGVDAVRRPAEHVERMRQAWRRLATRVEGLPEVPSPDVLRTVVKAHGAATAAAGLMLALGKAPRLSALALAALTVPVAAADAPSRAQLTAGAERSFVRDLGMVGGALLAATDRGGRPSVAWRVQHARERAATA